MFSYPSRDLEEHFDKFGEVLAFSLNKGFGFIQYKDVASAQRAFEAPSPQMNGRRLVIKPAVNSTWGPDAMQKQKEQQNELKPRQPNVWNTGAGMSGNGGGNNSHNNNNTNNHIPHRPTMHPIHSNPTPAGGSFEPTNDCEIIVMSRVLTTYAEAIETRLRGLGMSVDLLFPNSEVPLGKVLSNISERGCLYAILVTP